MGDSNLLLIFFRLCVHFLPNNSEVSVPAACTTRGQPTYSVQNNLGEFQLLDCDLLMLKMVLGEECAFPTHTYATDTLKFNFA